jgi:hypothetical protein
MTIRLPRLGDLAVRRGRVEVRGHPWGANAANPVRLRLLVSDGLIGGEVSDPGRHFSQGGSRSGQPERQGA